MGKHQGLSEDRRSEEKAWARILTVIFMGKNKTLAKEDKQGRQAWGWLV